MLNVNSLWCKSIRHIFKAKKNEYLLFQKTLLNNNCKNYYINILDQKKVNLIIKKLNLILFFI